MNEITKKIYEFGIIPVVKIDYAEDAIPVSRALRKGGLNCVEITFRTEAAQDSIRQIATEFPDMLIGAGTVLTTQQADQAINSGASFIVTPGFNPKIIDHCLDRGYMIYPGCSNATDIESALEKGLSDLKFFPAEASGGLPVIKALSGPFPSVNFIPTGGINEENLNNYLSCDKVIACGGSWMVKETLIKEKRFEEIEFITKNSIQKMLSFKLHHIGINCENNESAIQEAQLINNLFNWSLKNSDNSIFVGNEFEIMKMMDLGKNGHIGISTNNVDRAYIYLKNKGIEFNENTVQYDEIGKKKVAYLKNEISGFAIHLCKK